MILKGFYWFAIRNLLRASNSDKNKNLHFFGIITEEERTKKADGIILMLVHSMQKHILTVVYYKKKKRMKYNKNLSCLYFVGVSLKKRSTAALNIGCKHTTNDWIIFASIKIKEAIKCGDRKSYQYIPSDKFLFVQFFITTNIEFSNDFNGTFLWISITFTIGFTDKIILKRRIHWLNKIQIKKMLLP
jgi:hypothetical protein